MPILRFMVSPSSGIREESGICRKHCQAGFGIRIATSSIEVSRSCDTHPEEDASTAGAPRIQIPLPQGSQFRRPLTGHSVASRSLTGAALAVLAGSSFKAASAVHPVGGCRSRGQKTTPHAALRNAPRGELAQRRKSVPCKGFSCHGMAFGVLLGLPCELAVGAEDHAIASFFEAADCTLNFQDFGSRYWIRCAGIGTRRRVGSATSSERVRKPAARVNEIAITGDDTLALSRVALGKPGGL